MEEREGRERGNRERRIEDPSWLASLKKYNAKRTAFKSILLFLSETLPQYELKKAS